MSLCVHCGQPVVDSSGLCTYHVTGRGKDWAMGNRIMCDFFHRGIVLPSPSEPVGRSVDVFVGELEAA